MRKVFLFAILFLCCFNHLFAQTQTVGLFTRTVGSYDSGYILFPPVFNCDTTYLIDRCGKLVHKWPSTYTPGADAYLLQDGSLLRSGHYPNTLFDSCGCGTGGIIERIDWSGNVVWHYIISDSTQVQSHDICPMPNGNILVNVWESIPASLALKVGRDPAYLGSRLYLPKVMEIKPLGTDSAEIVWTWRLWDHLIQERDPAKPNYGIVSDHPELANINFVNLAAEPAKGPDWTHVNTVTYNPSLDQIMLSFRNFNEICIIDHSTTTAEAATHTGGNSNMGGDIIYRWGNPQVYGRGTPADTKLFLQHSPVWITNGKYSGQILIFNNGTGRTGGAVGSSVDIIDPPIDASGNYTIASGAAYGPSSLSWRYPATPSISFFSTNMGNAMVMPNGNFFINNANSGRFFEIDSTNTIVWKYVSPVSNGTALAQYDPAVSNAVYRCLFYPADYPAFIAHVPDPGEPIEIDPLPTSCDSSITGPNEVATLQYSQQLISSYPNPATNSITVQSNGNVVLKKIWITDITGRVMQIVIPIGRSQQVNIAQLVSGMYLLKAEDANGLTTQLKLIKQ